jgi:hypothetical protein
MADRSIHTVAPLRSPSRRVACDGLRRSPQPTARSSALLGVRRGRGRGHPLRRASSRGVPHLRVPPRAPALQRCVGGSWQSRQRSAGVRRSARRAPAGQPQGGPEPAPRRHDPSRVLAVPASSAGSSRSLVLQGRPTIVLSFVFVRGSAPPLAQVSTLLMRVLTHFGENTTGGSGRQGGRLQGLARAARAARRAVKKLRGYAAWKRPTSSERRVAT